MSLRDRKTEKRDFDVVIYGATSFVGEIISEHFAKNYKQSEVRWALGGRSKSRLEDTKARLVQLDSSLKDLEVVVADSQDKEALDKLSSRTKVVLTTVGPYAKYGDLVLQSCVENSTGYVDLTGEGHWAAQTIEKYHKKAEENSALIVHFCGFDSVPSDMGSLMMVDHIKTKLQAETLSVKALMGEAKGGVSGGTLDSVFNLFESGNAAQADLHQLCPSPKSCHAKNPGPKDKLLPFWDEDSKKWTCMFVMAPINTRVVRRSAALLGEEAGYSPKFAYEERMSAPNVFFAGIVTFGIVLFIALVAFRPTRYVLKKLLPAPGQGPSRQAIETGHWRCDYVATAKTKTGELKKIRGHASGKKDPGYGDTSAMIAEAAVYIVKNREKCAKGGVLTPASAFGIGYLERLKKYGMEFKVDN